MLHFAQLDLQKHQAQQPLQIFSQFSLQQYRMSIYSGFATRFQEQAYDHCIDSLLYVLQKRIIKFYQGEQADQAKFISVVTKLHQQMRNMEKNKYLEPKSSQSIAQLIKFVQLYQQNIVTNGQKDQSITPENDQVHSVQAAKPAEQQTSSKKKMSYWVQRDPKVEPTTQPQKQQEGQIQAKGKHKQQSPNHKSQDKQAQFTRTKYHNKPIFAVRAKNASINNLSRDKQQPHLSGIQSKPEQNRSISGLLNEHQPIAYSKASFKNHQQDQPTNTRSRKIKSINKSVNQIEHEYFSVKNDISDIIKDYIIKTKRSKKVMSRHSKHKMEYLGKINDF